MIKDLVLGFSTFFEAIGFVRKHKLWYFYLFPVILSITLFWISSEFRTVVDNYLETLIKETLGLNQVIDNGGIWDKIVSGFLYFFVTVTAFFIWFKINRYVVVILLSPLFSILSEKTDQILTGKNFPFSMKQLSKDVVRGVLLALKNIFLELSIMLAGFLIAWGFPPASIVTVPLVSVAAWYYMGFSFMDYNYERRKMGVSASSKEVWKRKGIAISNGFLFTMLAYIPIVGVVFGSIWAVVGASLAVNKEDTRLITNA